MILAHRRRPYAEPLEIISGHPLWIPYPYCLRLRLYVITICYGQNENVPI